MKTDVLVIGSGIGGAAAALQLSHDRERSVTVVTKEPRPAESNSSYAQGGIVGRGDDDSAALLVEDVIAAGAGLAWPTAVELLADEGPPLLERLFLSGDEPPFDRDESGRLSYGLEGAHSRRRILHVGDHTGQEIMQALLRQLEGCPNVQLLTGRTAVDVITFPHHSLDPLAIYQPRTCHGAYVFDAASGDVEPIVADATILATGGLGQIFLNTSNPEGARGDGLAMAARAGARIVNCEYVQFHPTTLHMHGPTKFLISEAVRGEGGRLLTPSGERFMARYDAERMELAPRDVVSRAIYWEMLANDWSHVMLDIASHRSEGWIRERFPSIHARCLEQGWDISRELLPVVPAAHYFCGGILVDLWGRTSIPGLYAVGEVSCTGVHGANRLASTSLLEGLLWGDRAGRHVRENRSERTADVSDVPPWDVSDLSHDSDPALVQGDMQTIRTLMCHYVGLVRSEQRLNRAIRELTSLWLNIEDFYRRARLSDGLIGLRNAVQAALLIARSAQRNRSSRGAHYRDDSRAPSGGPAGQGGPGGALV
jgi:L-aspartate oxidase